MTGIVIEVCVHYGTECGLLCCSAQTDWQ